MRHTVAFYDETMRQITNTYLPEDSRWAMGKIRDLFYEGMKLLEMKEALYTPSTLYLAVTDSVFAEEANTQHPVLYSTLLDLASDLREMDRVYSEKVGA